MIFTCPLRDCPRVNTRNSSSLGDRNQMSYRVGHCISLHATVLYSTRCEIFDLPPFLTSRGILAPKRGPYVEIVDRVLLAGLLATEMRRRGLNQPQTASCLDIPQGDISKLLHGKRASIALSAFQRIDNFLPQTAQKDLEKTVLRSEARAILKSHDEWLDQALAYYSSGIPLLESDRLRLPDAARTLIELGKAATPAFNKRGVFAGVLYCHLVRDDEVGPTIKRFERQAAKQGFALDRSDYSTAKRMWLAILRVFEPIINEPWSLERGCDELLRAKKMQTYLKVAFKRELILLDRKSDIQRAQHRTAREAVPFAWIWD